MRSVLGQVQERAPTPQTVPRNGAAPMVKELPYDYVATFALQGKPGNRVQDVINISTDGAFVAAAVGYSFLPKVPAALGEITVPRSPPTHTTLAEVFADGIVSRLVSLLNTPVDLVQTIEQLTALIRPIVNPTLIQCILVRLCGIDFKYSIIDSGSGRELQNQPIHNIAGLGKADGERPFRPLAKPMLFMPRSTIRIEVEEVSAGLLYQDSLLYIVLHGYKMLNYGTGLP
jgi:hypothetical protein